MSDDLVKRLHPRQIEAMEIQSRLDGTNRRLAQGDPARIEALEAENARLREDLLSLRSAAIEDRRDG